MTLQPRNIITNLFKYDCFALIEMPIPSALNTIHHKIGRFIEEYRLNSHVILGELHLRSCYLFIGSDLLKLPWGHICIYLNSPTHKICVPLSINRTKMSFTIINSSPRIIESTIQMSQLTAFDIVEQLTPISLGILITPRRKRNTIDMGIRFLIPSQAKIQFILYSNPTLELPHLLEILPAPFLVNGLVVKKRHLFNRSQLQEVTRLYLSENIL